jgi:hypothetical protein
VIAFIDLAAVAIAGLSLFVLLLIGLPGAAGSTWNLFTEMYAAHHDRWLVALIIICIAWSAVRWKAAWEALDEFKG